MQQQELYNTFRRLLVIFLETVIDKYNEELEKGYPESYLIPDKSLQALDRKIDELLEKIENAGFMEEFEDFTLSA